MGRLSGLWSRWVSALMADLTVLTLDAPIVGLAPRITARLAVDVRRRRDCGACVVVVEHEIGPDPQYLRRGRCHGGRTYGDVGLLRHSGSSRSSKASRPGCLPRAEHA